MTTPDRSTGGHDPVSARLVATLERRADTIGSGPAFTAADVVRAGRRAVRRRRATAVTATLTAVTAAVLGVTLLTPTPPGVPPAHPPASATPSPATFGLDVLSGKTVLRPDGSEVALALPSGTVASKVTRLPSGWLAEAQGDGVPSVWFLPYDGPPREVARSGGGYEVSADGRVLVVANTEVTAYELPSVREIARTRFDEAMGPLVLGVAGDVALLRGAQGDGSPSRAAVWNFRTGTLNRTSTEDRTWDFSDNGQALRRVDRKVSNHVPVDSCLDVVPATVRMPTGPTGWCGALAATAYGGTVSPRGDWVTVQLASADGSGSADGSDVTTVLAPTAQLRAGRWRPIRLIDGSGAQVLFWDTARTFVAASGDGYVRCATDGRCAALVLPAGLPEPSIVQRRGG